MTTTFSFISFGFFLLTIFGLLATILFSLDYHVYGEVKTNSDAKINLVVSYVNNTAQPYTVTLNPQEKFTLSQSYSWVRDQTSRFSLKAYSIDNSPYVTIDRVARGNFTLDISTDASHSVAFLAVPQYPIEVNGINGSAIFSPPSPTADNWFDVESDIQIDVPYVTKLDQEGARQQLKGWSLDGSDLNIITRHEQGTFSTPTIRSSDAHAVNFAYVTQYYITVISQYGLPAGSGWYDSGSIITISVTPSDDFPIRHTFEGWQGSTLQPNNGVSASVLVDSPKTVTASWSSDYLMLIIIGVVSAGVVAGSVGVYRNRRSRSTTIYAVKKVAEKKDDKVPSSPQGQVETEQPQIVDDAYSKEISSYILQKSTEKLDSFQNSNILLPERHAKLKEKLVQSESDY